MTFRSKVVQVDDEYTVVNTRPRACAISRDTEDSPEREAYITPHQRAVADVVANHVSQKRLECHRSKVNLDASKILAASEQVVAGTEYTFRLQLTDSEGVTDVAVIKALLPSTTLDPAQAKIVSILPAPCELFPSMEVPMGANQTQSSEQVMYGDEEDLINFVNAQKLGWEAGRHPRFGNLSFEEWGARFTGVPLDQLKANQLPTTMLLDDGAPMDQHFDWRTQSPDCVNSARVRDQAACGSCYAFAKTGVLSHRMCVQSNATKKLTLSPRYMVSAHYEGLNGCNGGFPKYSGKFLIDQGVPLEGCVPYEAGSLHTRCSAHRAY